MKKTMSLLLILFSTNAYAQHISGLYNGILFNDTTKMHQQYELALSEYKGKITGYSYTTYVVNDTFYYGIRKIRATRKADKLIIEDDQFIVNNFPEAPSKGVKRLTILQLNNLEDTVSALNGRWETNRTKIYYSVSGTMDLNRNNDSSHSALVSHLKELKIISLFDGSEKQQTIARSKSKNKKEQPAKTAPVIQPAPNSTAINSQKENKSAPAFDERMNKSIETFQVDADSLVLSFYDNGVVDGDIISVYLNGENIINSARLTEKPMKKTIYLNGVAEEIRLTLVAENLGSLPPNTGLLVVQDGSKRYQVHFSADLQTNATVVFKKRK